MMFFRPSHENWVRRIDSALKDIEHYRYYNRGGQIMHVAVAVLTTGYAYMGTSVCSKKDSYNRKRGYEIAVGRALKNAAMPGNDSVKFYVADVVGVDLRDECRLVVEEVLGPEWYPILPVKLEAIRRKRVMVNV